MNRVLRKIYGPRGDDVTGRWRKPYNVKLQNLNSTPSIVRMVKSMGWDGQAYSTNVAKRNSCRILIEKQERRSLGRPIYT
jgi:hypothetical protein